MYNHDEVMRLLDLMERQLKGLKTSLKAAQAVIEKEDNAWSDEEEMQYRMRHSS